MQVISFSTLVGSTLFSHFIVFLHRQLDIIQYLPQKPAAEFSVMNRNDSSSSICMLKKQMRSFGVAFFKPQPQKHLDELARFDGYQFRHTRCSGSVFRQNELSGGKRCPHCASRALEHPTNSPASFPASFPRRGSRELRGWSR